MAPATIAWARENPKGCRDGMFLLQAFGVPIAYISRVHTHTRTHNRSSGCSLSFHGLAKLGSAQLRPATHTTSMLRGVEARSAMIAPRPGQWSCPIPFRSSHPKHPDTGQLSATWYIPVLKVISLKLLCWRYSCWCWCCRRRRCCCGR